MKQQQAIQYLAFDVHQATIVANCRDAEGRVVMRATVATDFGSRCLHDSGGSQRRNYFRRRRKANGREHGKPPAGIRCVERCFVEGPIPLLFVFCPHGRRESGRIHGTLSLARRHGVAQL